jgi:flagellar basal-body rod protein FlgF
LNGLTIMATDILTDASGRLQQIAQNITNLTTPGYKSASFKSALASSAKEPEFEQGALSVTGRALDLALTGAGAFRVETESGPETTRNGAFHRNAKGVWTSTTGQSLLTTSGEPLVTKTDNPVVNSDGSVFEDGAFVGRIALTDSPDSASSPHIVQSALEISTTHYSVEMLNIMSAMRSAHIGKSIVGMADEMFAKTLTAVSGAG